ncbi:DUF397 domain-containing protein [Nonomuraea sp. NPDC046802]|uniref:DUF397 domain-containing protein n=1 Tax=Nonomuraea sp. NPDC046802 TaxID=3154919 RepID=UPI0033E78068
MTEKPTVEGLGIDLDAVNWRRSGSGPDAIEIAFVRARGQRWVLMRLASRPAGLIHVFSAHEWDCFVLGARNGEFDDAAS